MLYQIFQRDGCVMDRQYVCSDDNGERHALRAWFASGLGANLLEQERAVLDDLLQDLFGYYLLQLGVATPVDLLSASRIRGRVMMDKELPPRVGACPVRALTHAVPVSADSVDVVLLHHTLEFAGDPHAILREVERILIPEGHVVIVAFNPWSFWGVWRLLRRRRGRPPWCGHFLGMTRIKDWMGLLGFDTVEVRPLFFRPPLRHEGMMRRMRFLDRAGERWWPLLGGVHVVVAKKRVATLTPIKPRWLRPKRIALVADAAEPSSGRVING